jgi:RNA polymerase sigma-70 factor (ECF subfamily)
MGVLMGTGRHAARSRTSGSASDGELAAAAKAGDRRAFAAQLRRHDDEMRRLAFRMLGDRDAMDDVLQNAYVNAFRALPQYREDAQFATWLYRITYNACIDELRRARRRPVPVANDEDAGQSAANPERDVTTADTVRTALAALPTDQRAAVLLVDGEGLDHDGAARILGVPPGTLASRLSRARASMRRTIEEAGE